jgi:hypothetical protein
MTNGTMTARSDEQEPSKITKKTHPARPRRAASQRRQWLRKLFLIFLFQTVATALFVSLAPLQRLRGARNGFVPEIIREWLLHPFIRNKSICRQPATPEETEPPRLLGGLLPGFLLHPIEQFRALLRVELRPAVYQEVFWRRHFAFPNLVADMPPSLADALFVVMRPIGKVQAAAPILNIAHHQPRNRGNVTVPGPFGFERMAVITGIFQKRGDGWRGCVASQNVVPWQNGRVQVRWIGKLQGNDRKQTDNSNRFEPLFHDSIKTCFRGGAKYALFMNCDGDF